MNTDKIKSLESLLIEFGIRHISPTLSKSIERREKMKVLDLIKVDESILTLLEYIDKIKE